MDRQTERYLNVVVYKHRLTETEREVETYRYSRQTEGNINTVAYIHRLTETEREIETDR